jgi:hypothetical protein
MKFFYSLIISLLFFGILHGQYVNVKYTVTAPEIDGFVEEIWDAAKPFPIAKNFRDEKPTITATWQALCDNDNFYVLVVVEDNNHWPGWEAGGDNWLYDKPEVYWDVNEVLTDGGGAGNSPGHWQLANGFTEGMYDTPITKEGSASVNPGGTYAYSLVGEGYAYEMAVPWANLKDKYGAPYDRMSGRCFGFDVTVIDQDKGITTSRQRAVWTVDGTIDESWNDMDGAGRISTLVCGGCESDEYLNLSTYSNTISNKESTGSIMISSNIFWTASSDQSWLVVSPLSYTGNSTLTYTAASNTGAFRTAVVTINSNLGSQDLRITQEAGGAGVSKFKKEGIRIYPNPATDRIIIQGGIDRVELFNSQGIKVKELKIYKSTFHVSDLPVGVYQMKAYKNGDFAGVAKFFKN